MCELILQKNDTFDLIVEQTEKDYISKNAEFVCNVEYTKLFKKNIEHFRLIVNKCCDKISKEKTTKGLNPYSFYSDIAFVDYKSDFYSECKTLSGCAAPEYLFIIFDWIALKCEDFQNTSVYLTSYMHASRRINSDDFNNRTMVYERKVQLLEAGLIKQISDFNEAMNLKMDTFEEKIAETEKQSTERSITILGIFAAIVLTFNSGLTFSSTVLQNLINSNIYRAIIITIVLGLIIANVLLGLFYYLDHVIEKSEKKRKKLKSVLPMIFLNIILAVLLALTVGAWNINFVENRGFEGIKETQTALSTETEQTTLSFADPNKEHNILEEATIYAEITVLSVERVENDELLTTVVEESTRSFIDVTP